MHSWLPRFSNAYFLIITPIDVVKHINISHLPVKRIHMHAAGPYRLESKRRYETGLTSIFPQKIKFPQLHVSAFARGYRCNARNAHTTTHNTQHHILSKHNRTKDKTRLPHENTSISLYLQSERAKQDKLTSFRFRWPKTGGSGVASIGD